MSADSFSPDDLERLAALVPYLRQFVTDDRAAKISANVEQRTRHVVVALEDVHKPHNASAVLRNCDAFGIQDVHVIENKAEFDPNHEVTIGADRWLTLHRHNDVPIEADLRVEERLAACTHDNTIACIDRLKARGYAVAATTPHTDLELRDLPLDRPVALLFGTELLGLSDEALARVDRRVKIPMCGFSESFNLSVSVAVCLYDVTQRLRASEIDWQLRDRERLTIERDWLRQTIDASEALEAEFDRRWARGLSLELPDGRQRRLP
ncbi:MAG: TrmH family RNA methyltransferase [Geitlerinemataceae cyanobacterium]